MQNAAPQSEVSTARAFRVADYFRVPLIDLGSIERPDMAGIYIPGPEIGNAPVGLSAQFLEDAAVYHRQYSNTAYFKLLISDALKRMSFHPASPAILDIGSGSGNSVFPCLELFADCRIVATDLSPNLLRILLDHVNGAAGAAGRVAPVCMDATRDYYAEQVFDFVLGAVILHHLIDPGAAIAAASRALKPGGYAVFFEPFENGNAILRIAYAEILARGGLRQPRCAGRTIGLAAAAAWLTSTRRKKRRRSSRRCSRNAAGDGRQPDNSQRRRQVRTNIPADR